MHQELSENMFSLVKLKKKPKKKEYEGKSNEKSGVVDQPQW